MKIHKVRIPSQGNIKAREQVGGSGCQKIGLNKKKLARRRQKLDGKEK